MLWAGSSEARHNLGYPQEASQFPLKGSRFKDFAFAFSSKKHFPGKFPISSSKDIMNVQAKLNSHALAAGLHNTQMYTSETHLSVSSKNH